MDLFFPFPHSPRVKFGLGKFPFPRNLKAGYGPMEASATSHITSLHMLKDYFLIRVNISERLLTLFSVFRFLVNSVTWLTIIITSSINASVGIAYTTPRC